MSSPSSLTPSLYSFVSTFFLFLIDLFTQSLARSFDALELYIQSQKAVLARTQLDVDHLRLLLEQAVTYNFFDALEKRLVGLPILFDTLYSHSPKQLNDNVFHFNHQPDIAAEV